jgi:hypothetical protein
MKKPNVTIRIGAAHDEVRVDGITFDRSQMKREEKSKLRRLVRDAFRSLHQAGVWGKQARVV